MKLEKRINKATGKASHFVEIKVSVYTLYYSISDCVGFLENNTMIDRKELWVIDTETKAEVQFNMLSKYEAELIEVLK